MAQCSPYVAYVKPYPPPPSPKEKTGGGIRVRVRVKEGSLRKAGPNFVQCHSNLCNFQK